MTDDNKNLFLAIGLSLLVIIAWNYFYGVPQVNKAQQQAQQTQVQTQTSSAPPVAAPAPPAVSPESRGLASRLPPQMHPRQPKPAPKRSLQVRAFLSIRRA